MTPSIFLGVTSVASLSMTLNTMAADTSSVTVKSSWCQNWSWYRSL